MPKLPVDFLTIHISFVNKLESWLAGAGLAFISIGIFFVMVFFYTTKHTLYQGIIIDGIDVGGLTREAAAQKLTTQRPVDLANTSLTLITDNTSLASSGATLKLNRDYQSAVNTAFEIGRVGFPPARLLTIIKLKLQPKLLSTNLGIDEQALEAMLKVFAIRINTEHQDPRAVLGQTNNQRSLKIEIGTPGRALDIEKTTEQIAQALAQFNNNKTLMISPIVASVGAQLNQEQTQQARERAEKIVGQKLTFTAPDTKLLLNDQQVISLLAFADSNPYDETKIETTIQAWQQKINREPQDATFEFDQHSLKVSKFVPPREGLQLQQTKTKEQLLLALKDLETSVQASDSTKKELVYELPIISKPPTKTLEKTNSLGIKERIGVGESTYFHSIPNRVHNVGITADRVSNVIIKPGEEFSFNKTLGDVSAETGFRSAYVIMEGKTVLGDGGGVCQVSSTLFRAVVNSGLPVTRRLQHSYRVNYYEQNSYPGLDATVYAGNVDLRFVNDTDHHVLIHFENDPKNYYLKAELYGTSDGRSTSIISHQTWDARPAAPTVYIDTTEIPRGKIQQVDWSAPGIRARVINEVRDKNGKVIRTDEYVSNYIPWSAKYLRGI